MGKRRDFFICNECGHEEPKWLGRCPECGSWNSFREMKASTGPGSGSTATGRGGIGAGASGGRHKKLQAVSLEEVEVAEGVRLDTGLEEVNRVLGSGAMLGATALIGGEPGIGKSTLMLQLSASIRTDRPVLYISGEESLPQIRMRAERLGIVHPSRSKIGAERAVNNGRGGVGSAVKLVSESDLDRIMAVLREVKPQVVIVDSIQTLISADAGSVPGTVNQLKYGCHELIDWAREEQASLFLVAHVTKEGAIAGPKVIEHMVDTVLYFEQADSGLRIVRAMKNRHGSVDEIGLFTMEADGLVQVPDAASFFLEQREDELPPGITAAPVYEGTRVLMVEIQALVVPAKSGFSRIYSDKIDNNRVSRIAAVLEKLLSVRFSDQDIYINVAGGIRLGEVGIELPLAMALYSARTGIPVPKQTALAGEISLAGEIRPTAHMQRRIRTAADMGFKRFIGPRDVRVQEAAGAAGAVEVAAAGSVGVSRSKIGAGGIAGGGAEGLAAEGFQQVRTLGEAVKQVFGRK
ncbi:MAG: DNA repair protein RadA [Spirochaetota bacterium]